MTIIVGRMMVGLGMRSMVMAAVSIAGQEANQNQGQAPAAKSECGHIAVTFEAATKCGNNGDGDQNGHGNVKPSPERRLKTCQCRHASKQKGQGHAVHQTQSARRDPKTIPESVAMSDLFFLHDDASYNSLL